MCEHSRFKRANCGHEWLGWWLCPIAKTHNNGAVIICSAPHNSTELATPRTLGPYTGSYCPKCKRAEAPSAGWTCCMCGHWNQAEVIRAGYGRDYTLSVAELNIGIACQGPECRASLDRAAAGALSLERSHRDALARYENTFSLIPVLVDAHVLCEECPVAG
ncbi:hypothetical protein B0T26DRAFT_682057 [Lasiosphaeria miniovina]|uniref:Uncharacterized protein n=1 Tax=Lasiosphaeria miniovina TaxID=1954250 RepID=A0AA39ZR70_9PEZI|nr:uncharacterized protein B0T26DRAFT_682057 [Lasiosphaeria miniovina]KAK0701970.1 hypothetical protein B0T26DRAFT_682057 [Lasiosphaeria miniovina]